MSDSTDSQTAGMAPSSPQEQKIVYTFNKVFADFVVFLKRSDASVKEALKPHYRTIDSLSTSTIHLDWFRDNVNVASMGDVQSCMEDEAALVVRGVTAGMLARCTGDEEADHALLVRALSFVNLLAAVHHLYREHRELEDEPEEQAKLGDLLQRTLRIVHGIQQADDVSDAMNGIVDDDLMTYLERMVLLEDMLRQTDGTDSHDEDAEDPDVEEEEKKQEEEETGGERRGGKDEPDMFGDMFSKFKDTKLGELAREITDEIDLDKIDLKNPMDLLNIGNLTDEKSALGSIVGKMTSKMKSKMESGSLRYEDLMAEAMGLVKGLDLSAMQNNPMFSAMMNSMQAQQQQQQQPGGRGPPPPPTSRTPGGVSKGDAARERMRRKLDARNNR